MYVSVASLFVKLLQLNGKDKLKDCLGGIKRTKKQYFSVSR